MDSGQWTRDKGKNLFEPNQSNQQGTKPNPSLTLTVVMFETKTLCIQVRCLSDWMLRMTLVGLQVHNTTHQLSRQERDILHDFDNSREPTCLLGIVYSSSSSSSSSSSKKEQADTGDRPVIIHRQLISLVHTSAEIEAVAISGSGRLNFRHCSLTSLHSRYRYILCTIFAGLQYPSSIQNTSKSPITIYERGFSKKTGPQSGRFRCGSSQMPIP